MRPVTRRTPLLAALLLLAASCAGGALTPRSAPDSGPTGLQVRCFPVDVGTPSQPFLENCYLAFDPATGDALVIDPGTRSLPMERLIASRGLRVRAILNTHGHRDHIGGDGYYAGKYRAPLYAHAGDRERFEGKPFAVTFFEREGELPVPGFTVAVLATPGHSPGSVAYVVGGVLFSGDTLFARGIGRTWGEDEAEALRLQEEMKGHIRAKLFPLPDETPVYPGHDEATTIGAERRENPFLK